MSAAILSFPLAPFILGRQGGSISLLLLPWISLHLFPGAHVMELLARQAEGLQRGLELPVVEVLPPQTHAKSTRKQAPRHTHTHGREHINTRKSFNPSHTSARQPEERRQC